jgi:hypothetical protein
MWIKVIVKSASGQEVMLPESKLIEGEQIGIKMVHLAEEIQINRVLDDGRDTIIVTIYEYDQKERRP